MKLLLPEHHQRPAVWPISQKVPGFSQVVAIYEGSGGRSTPVVKDDATAESIEAMILKYC
ncbi:MAG: hypothetical protein ACLU38_01330 [Dysosmobacter sp.]